MLRIVGYVLKQIVKFAKLLALVLPVNLLHQFPHAQP